MSRHDYDTRNMWKSFGLLLNSVIAMIVIATFGLLFQNQIIEFLDQPSYTQEELDEMRIRSQKRIQQAESDNWDLIKNGIHVRTGLKADKNVNVVISACTSCHSAKLITQNRATRQGWKTMIRWMQETQGLADLGTREPIILDYLAKHYAPVEVGRRANLDLTEVKWYILDLDEAETD